LAAVLAAAAGCAGGSPCEARSAEAAGAFQGIAFRDELGEFVVTRALFVLDGAVVADVRETPERPVPETMHVMPRTPAPGEHTLQVLIQLRGDGHGVFSYLREYRFEVKSSHVFTVSNTRPLRLEVMLWKRGDFTTPLEQRPALCYAEL
jgi:hypothetical protein